MHVDLLACHNYSYGPYVFLAGPPLSSFPLEHPHAGSQLRTNIDNLASVIRCLSMRKWPRCPGAGARAVPELYPGTSYGSSRLGMIPGVESASQGAERRDRDPTRPPSRTGVSYVFDLGAM